MQRLSSRKLAALASGIAGLLGLVAMQVFQGGLTDQQFVLVALLIASLGVGGAGIQGLIDLAKVKNGVPGAGAP